MIAAGLIVLNESEFIADNLRQHYDLFDKIVIVEGADVHYPLDRTTMSGLSIDDTAAIIQNFQTRHDPEGKITFIRHGIAGDGREGHGKCVLRNIYAQQLQDADIFVHLDADEFYTCDNFARIIAEMEASPKYCAFQYPSIHFWKNREQVITGGYYDIQHFRFWRVQRGWHYGYTELASHNFPRASNGHYLQRQGKRMRKRNFTASAAGLSHDLPFCHHFGFARSAQAIADKNAYYANRGEVASRPQTVDSRRAWFADELPEGLQVHKWNGGLPEVYR